MDVYLDPIIEWILKSWSYISMYDISKPVDHNQFQFHGILTLKKFYAPRLTHFCGM